MDTVRAADFSGKHRRTDADATDVLLLPVRTPSVQAPNQPASVVATDAEVAPAEVPLNSATDAVDAAGTGAAGGRSATARPDAGDADPSAATTTIDTSAFRAAVARAAAADAVAGGPVTDGAAAGDPAVGDPSTGDAAGLDPATGIRGAATPPTGPVAGSPATNGSGPSDVGATSNVGVAPDGGCPTDFDTAGGAATGEGDRGRSGRRPLNRPVVLVLAALLVAGLVAALVTILRVGTDGQDRDEVAAPPPPPSSLFGQTVDVAGGWTVQIGEPTAAPLDEAADLPAGTGRVVELQVTLANVGTDLADSATWTVKATADGRPVELLITASAPDSVPSRTVQPGAFLTFPVAVALPAAGVELQVEAISPDAPPVLFFGRV